MLDRLLCLPPTMSAHGPIIDHMIVSLHWFMLVLFVGWGCFFTLCLWKFRKGNNPKADYHGVRSHFSTHAEAAVIIFEVFLLLGFALPFWTQRVNEFPKPEDKPVEVRVIGSQFLWRMHYPGVDGKFGKTSADLVKPGNELGIDRSDENAKDDFVLETTGHLPIGRPAVLQLTSMDVIHNYAIREMRIAQDAIPGSEIPMWFTPTEIGETNVICGQLCGSGHFSMKGFLVIDSEADYEA
ncbi:MAG TPA: cytochrome c oxidase subunit II, partial [Chryseolinea sp.]